MEKHVAPSREGSNGSRKKEVPSRRNAVRGPCIDETYFEYAVVDSQYRYVESTAAEIEDQNVPFTAALFVEAVSNSCGSRLVNDPQDIQAGDSTGVLGSLSLGIVEVRWYRNHGVRDGLS